MIININKKERKGSLGSLLTYRRARRRRGDKLRSVKRKIQGEGQAPPPIAPTAKKDNPREGHHRGSGGQQDYGEIGRLAWSGYSNRLRGWGHYYHRRFWGQ